MAQRTLPGGITEIGAAELRKIRHVVSQNRPGKNTVSGRNSQPEPGLIGGSQFESSLVSYFVLYDDLAAWRPTAVP